MNIAVRVARNQRDVRWLSLECNVVVVVGINFNLGNEKKMMLLLCSVEVTIKNSSDIMNHKEILQRRR
jgi:hypothetical protein